MLAKATASRHSAPNDGGQEDGEVSTADAIIQALGAVLLEKRQEAMNWRTQSGIENDWQEDEEFYQGIDRANPEGDSNVGKPVSPTGGAVNRAVDGSNTPAARSSVFIPITRAYVDAAAARVADMLLPNDDAPWQIKATPNIQPVQAQPVTNPASAVPALMTPVGEAAAIATTGAAQPGATPITSSSITPTQTAEEQAAARANVVITDWLVECQWHAETRKAIEDAALIGTGVLKGPFPVKRRSFKYEKGANGQYTLVEKVETVPITRRVNPRNLWTDPSGGEDHQSGSYVWELDNIGSRQLRKLLEDDTYLHENILRALREGPGAKSGRDRADSAAWQVDVGATFPLWYFYGDIDKRTMIAAGIPPEELPPGDDDAVSIPAMVVMCNDWVIKVAQTPLDAGGFPYDIFPWQRRPGVPWGKGVARQMRTPQRMLNAGVRAEMDNGGLTSGPQFAIRQKWIQAIDGDNSVITPRKGWYITADAPQNAKLEDCISFTNIESAINELELIINRAMRFAEDATGLPMLMQGQQGEATTTATGMTILNNNGSTVLRRIARTFDDRITEPHIRRYYYWLLANPGNDDAKGDFQIDARGSTYLVDRDLQAQTLNQLFPMFAQHQDVHPGRLAEEVAQANRLNYKRIMLTDAEKAERAKNPPPEDPRITGIRLTNESRERVAAAEREVKIAGLEVTRDTKLADIAARLGISEDNIKAALATAVMGLQAKSADNTANRVAKADHEPPGKAPAGEGFSR